MAKLTDVQIKTWIRNNERFSGRSDGNGLYLCFPEAYQAPFWRFRYKFSGKARVMLIGYYSSISLAKAREIAKELHAKVALGYDVAAEKQERKEQALRSIEQEKNAKTVSQLAYEYYEQVVIHKWKHHDIFRRRIEKDINPNIGKMKIEDVRPIHIDDLLRKIKKRGAPTIANDVLRWIRRIFNYAIKRYGLTNNPTAPFDMSDAGGVEQSRDRWLSEDELQQLFYAMKITKGFARENELTIKLLLVLCCRKMELCGASWDEFDLNNAIWHLPSERTKNGDGIDIPLPPQALEWLSELKQLSCNSTWVLPARKMQHKMIPHIQESTLPVALAKVKTNLPNIPNFTIHDFRRTARSHLAALNVNPIVAERCLNHRIKGVEGIYNRYEYFEERKEALLKLANFITIIEESADKQIDRIAS